MTTKIIAYDNSQGEKWWQWLLLGLVVAGAWLALGQIARAQVISTELDVGATGAEVIKLQTFLATNRTVYPEGLVTGYYGVLTEKAVRQFQIGYGLPGVGRVGPLTLININNLIRTGRPIDVTAPMIGSLNTQTTDDNIVVFWNTSELASGRLFYSLNPLANTEAMTAKTEPYISGSMLNDPTLSLNKTINLPNLLPRTTYYLMAETIDQNGNVSVWNGTATTK